MASKLEAPDGAETLENATEKWLQDGTSEKEPVTTSTPEQETVDSQQSAEITQQQEVEGQATEPTEGQPQSASGDEGSQGAEQSDVSKETEEIVWKLEDGTELRVPSSAKMAVTRKGETEYLPASEVRKGGMLEKDYRIKTAELARLRGEADRERREFVANQRRLKARENALDILDKEIKGAQGDPEKLEKLLKRQEYLQNDPELAEQLKELDEGRNAKLELEIQQEQAALDAAQEAAKQAVGWVDELSRDERFAGIVDTRSVIDEYSRQLQEEKAQFSREAIEQLFIAKAEPIQRAVDARMGNVNSELEKMKKELDALRNNKQTEHALNRAGAPNIAPSRGKPPTPSSAPKGERFGIDKLQDKTADWAYGKET